MPGLQNEETPGLGTFLLASAPNVSIITYGHQMVADASLGSVYSSLTSIDLKPRRKHTATESSHATEWIYHHYLH